MVESLRRRAGRFGLDIVFVNVWEGSGAAEEVSDYRQRWGLDATVLLDETGGYARALQVRGVPTNVFVDERGIVREVGASRSEELLAGAVALEPRLGDDGDGAIATERTPRGFASP